jgi:phosphoribosyl 1,2-cyclic phosphate phosphodiesterase
LKVRFLGTGTSQGVPVIACKCKVCTSPNPKDNRLRTSILVESDNTSIVIDSGPDFRQQMLREQVDHLHAVVFTHEHKDHIAGLDDVRAYNFFNEYVMPVYATTRVQEALKREYAYIFSDVFYPGIPKIELISIDKHQDIQIGDITLKPIEVMHYKLPVLGFRINNFTYITDAKSVNEEELKKFEGTDILVLNALRRETHVSHFTLEEAIRFAEKIQPKKCYFTHLSHQIGLHDELEKELPAFIKIAYDGMQLEI